MSASLPSNDGESRFAIDLHTRSEYAHQKGFESLIQFKGRHWDGDHTHPICGSVDGLWISLVEIKKLREHIIAWTSLPLDLMDVAMLTGEFELAKLPGQRALIRFGKRQDVITGFNPIITVLLEAGPFRSEFYFVTDQSCLGSFARSLPNG
jgi:hypothetical protein